MTDMQNIEVLIDKYVDCWKIQRPTYDGIFEDNNFGCENFQIFQNNFHIQKFNHEELCQLSSYLTRSLRGQINRDHKMFWSWCSHITYQFRDVQLFNDLDWVEAFRCLINLVLAKNVGNENHLKTDKGTEVNFHLLQVSKYSHIISAPLSFSVLEGLLRRKNRNYVDKDGTINNGCKIGNRFLNKGNKLNRIRDSLILFEQKIVVERNRPCTALDQLKGEIPKLYPTKKDIYLMIDEWRNDPIHGHEFWTNKVPIIINLICLLTIDEIDPNNYDNKIDDLVRHIEWQKDIPYKAPWNIFPPDLF